VANETKHAIPAFLTALGKGQPVPTPEVGTPSPSTKPAHLHCKAPSLEHTTSLERLQSYRTSPRCHPNHDIHRGPGQKHTEAKDWS